MPARFRKRPLEVEAVQFTDDNVAEVLEFGGENVWYTTLPEPLIGVHTLEGDVYARPGSWIVKGQVGEFWPIRGDIFEETYERVEDESSS